MRHLLLAAVLLAGCSTMVDTGYHEYDPDSYSGAELTALLGRCVDAEGRIDYARWKAEPADVAALDSFLNLVANAAPDSRPELFPTVNARLAYWMNAYNALVIRSILEKWPLDSVNDVKDGIGLFKGSGFFANRRFRVGRRWRTLRDIEETLRKIEDPRMHFAINCGSGSCPPLDATAFAGEDVDAVLDRKAREFVNDPKNVRVKAGKVELSRIFEWYSKDFETAAPEGILDYIGRYAAPPLAKQLAAAKAGGFGIVYREYDWGINKTGF